MTSGADSVVSSITSGNIRACATFTSHLSAAVFTAVSEYVPPGSSEPDKIKLFVSYNRGVSWVLKSTYEGFDPAVDCRSNELDLEVIISGSDTIAFIAAGYNYSGHAYSGILRVNVTTGINIFSVWQFGGWNLSSVNTYNPKVTSNNTKYGNTAQVFMTVSHDSANGSGYKAAQRFAVLSTPYTNNTLTYRIANSSNGGFYWGHTTPLQPYIWQDICFYDSLGVDILYSVYNNIRAASILIYSAKSYDYGISSISAFNSTLTLADSNDQLKVVSCGGANNRNLLIGLRHRNVSLNNYDFRIYITTNGGLNWNFQFAENSNDTVIFIDIQAVKLSQARYKLAYTTTGKKDYYRGVTYITGSGFVFTPLQQVNDQPSDISFYGIKAGYFNSPGSDSCLSFWGRDTALGQINLYSTNLCKVPVGVQNNSEYPKAFFLSQNYPNPFNPSTNIKFDIPNDAEIKITVYDMLGSEVKVLVNEFNHAGSYEVDFDASALPSGVYFYTLTAGSYSETKKMLLIK
ncbi:MAG: T9SS type A sorting domain-containing protein [Ignavibacteria bacterium]|nr:T9SS type A sorting domain-containing protein [Ignavibacteria bacterium]